MVVIPEPEFVDIGLSVKWADRNLGAAAAEDAGMFFAWGEVELKDVYSSETYKWFDGYALTKYKSKGSILDMEDDAARVLLGEGFRIPTCEEIDELTATLDDEDNYESYWKVQDGVEGWYIEYRYNHNSIFIPTAGARQDHTSFKKGEVIYFWSNQTDNSNADKGTLLRAEHPYTKLNANKSSLLKSYGIPIRPVAGK